MDLDQLMKFAHAYVTLGWSVQEQLADIIRGDLSDINPRALVEIDQRLRGYNEDLDAAIDAAKAECN